MNNCHDYEKYIANLEFKEETPEGYAADSVFFCLDADRDRIVGAVNIRHYLNENLYLTGGHIGDGIRPSERRKGYATAMIGLALDECRKLGINKVLMTCDRNNLGSARSIMNNGGIFESEIEDDGEIENRYWITLHEETIETDRLLLRRAMPSDWEAMSAWTTDPRVYRYLLSNALDDPRAIIPWLQRNDPNSRELYRMLICRREDKLPVGVVVCYRTDEPGTWEIAYNLRFDCWGKGYAVEAAQALMNYVQTQNGARRFLAECAKENTASARVIEKLGMHYLRDSSYAKKDGSRVFESIVYERNV